MTNIKMHSAMDFWSGSVSGEMFPDGNLFIAEFLGITKARVMSFLVTFMASNKVSKFAFSFHMTRNTTKMALWSTIGTIMPSPGKFCP